MHWMPGASLAATMNDDDDDDDVGGPIVISRILVLTM
jgi:hypothetical protein